MNPPLNPDLFARLMKLSDSARIDLLEFLGGTEVEQDGIEALINDIESRAAQKAHSKPS